MPSYMHAPLQRAPLQRGQVARMSDCAYAYTARHNVRCHIIYTQRTERLKNSIAKLIVSHFQDFSTFVFIQLDNSGAGNEEEEENEYQEAHMPV